MDLPEAMVHTIEVVRWRGGDHRDDLDSLVVEEPLEIRINDVPFAVTMRTPGHDEALAVGFLATEGVVGTRNDVFDVLHCADPEFPDLRNIVNVLMDPERALAVGEGGRQRYATSSCGLCGRASIDAVRQSIPPLPPPPRLRGAMLIELPDRLRAAQSAFERTGGLHAAGLFDERGALLHAAEDVGRHNAVDKVVGMALLHGPWPAAGTILMVSGRAGFEIAQKAAVARIAALCSVSAPSSLAVALAREMNLILVGFLRGESMNVYSGMDSVY